MPDAVRIRVYDNGGRTIDRYMVIYMLGENYWFWRSMDERPAWPLGFNQFGGSEETKFKYQRRYGKPVKFDDLSPEVQEAVCNGLAWS